MDSTTYFVNNATRMNEAAAAQQPDTMRHRLTRHRLRRRRTRTAATLLTGASLAFGAAALRPALATANTAPLASCAPTQPG
jgi:hypothetical protein